MDLPTCPDCSNPVSPQAITCPHCGRPYPVLPAPTPQFSPFLFIFMLVFMSGYGLVGYMVALFCIEVMGFNAFLVWTVTAIVGLFCLSLIYQYSHTQR